MSAAAHPARGSTAPATTARALLESLREIGAHMSRAIAARQDGAAFSDEEVEVFYAIALKMLAQNDLARAHPVLTRVCDLRPGEVRYLRALASVRRELGDTRGAAALFQFIDMLDPGDPRNALDLAECWLRSGQPGLVGKARSLLAMTVAHCEALGRTGLVPERALALLRFLDREGDTNEQAAHTTGDGAQGDGGPAGP